MKLNEVYNRPLKEITEAMELSEMKVHTDEGGNVKSVELKYISCKTEPEAGIQRNAFFKKQED